MQNVVGNDKKYKGIWTSQFLLATTIVGWKVVGGIEFKRKEPISRKVVQWIKAFI